MEQNKKLYLFYFGFLTLSLISFSVSSIFFNNLYTEFLYQMTITGTLCFISGFLVNSIGWPLGNKKYKKLRAVASLAFPFSCLDLIFKTFSIKLLPPLLTGLIVIFTGLAFILTYFYSVLEAAKIKNISKLLSVEAKFIKKERNYLPILLVVLAIVIFTSLLLINPGDIFSPKVQFLCGSAGIFLSLFAGVFFAVVAAAEIYKAATNKQ